jgi:hypothetical protein
VKKITIAQASSVVIAASILALFLVPASFAMRGTHTSSVAESCNDKASVFPSSLSTRLNKNHKGSVSGFELHLSNADGKCSVMIFSSNSAESEIDLTDGHNSYEAFIASN